MTFSHGGFIINLEKEDERIRLFIRESRNDDILEEKGYVMGRHCFCNDECDSVGGQRRYKQLKANMTDKIAQRKNCFIYIANDLSAEKTFVSGKMV